MNKRCAFSRYNYRMFNNVKMNGMANFKITSQ